MKKLFLLLFSATVVYSTSSYAGYAVKKVSATATEQVAVSASNNEADATVKSTFSTADVSTADEEMSMVIGKKSFFTKLSDRLKESLDISKGVYILLAVIGFGWLAMGLNDNFEGFDWLISLVLYFLGWLPGVIYTLIMMKKYY